jgi:hypothetical protein
MKLTSLFASMLAVVMLTSCEDLFEDGTGPDGSKPYVAINTPTANHSLTKANGVAVNLTISDKDEVKDLHVQIQDITGETTIVDFTKHYTEKVVTVDTVVAQNQISPGTYKLLITAKDKRANLEMQEVTFKVKE